MHSRAQWVHRAGSREHAGRSNVGRPQACTPPVVPAALDRPTAGPHLEPHLAAVLSQRRQQAQVALQRRQVGRRHRLLPGAAAAVLRRRLQRLRPALHDGLSLGVL